MRRTRGWVLIPLTAMLLVSCLAGASVQAYFSDIETNAGNTFTAGTVDIHLENDGTGANTPLYDPALDGDFYPGSGVVVKTLRVHNDGSLDIKISGFSATFSGETKLADGLMIKIEEVDKSDPTKLYPLYSGVFSSLEGAVQVTGVQAVKTGGSVDLRTSIWMPEDAPGNDNDYQGLTMTADIGVTAKQT